jgi:uncharacterized protein YnzC (UPF0291/DUF896 family)
LTNKKYGRKQPKNQNRKIKKGKTSQTKCKWEESIETYEIIDEKGNKYTTSKIISRKQNTIKFYFGIRQKTIKAKGATIIRT